MATPIPPNRARFSVAEVVAATGGATRELTPGTAIEGVSTDTRTLTAGALFVALRGPDRDGHAFVAAARERGATPLVAAGAGIAGPRIEVDDPLVALGRIARAHVERLAARRAVPRLAVGGAAGKTTTKTLAAAAVEALCGPTLVTAGNLNNRIGVPMTLLTLTDRHCAAVLECATSEPGEIVALGHIVNPDVALVLNVGIEHSERLGGLEAIADEEAQLLAAARAAAVTASDEPLLRARLENVRAPRKLLFAGDGDAAADVALVAREVRADGTTRIRLRVGAALAADAPAEVELVSPLLGPAAATNVAAALAGALALLGRPASHDELAAAARALGAVEAVPGRLRPLLVGERLVLDDTYNSNPRSLAAALAAVGEVAARTGGAPSLALGDMLELGELEADAHDAAVRDAAALDPELLVLVGPRMSAAARRVALAVPCELHDDSARADAAVERLARGRGVVLLKGSRGTRMELLLAALAARAESPK